MNDSNKEMIGNLIISIAKVTAYCFSPSWMKPMIGASIPGVVATEVVNLWKAVGSDTKNAAYDHVVSYFNTTSGTPVNHVHGAYSNNPYSNSSSCDEGHAFNPSNYYQIPSNSTPTFPNTKMTNDTFSKEYGRSTQTEDLAKNVPISSVTTLATAPANMLFAITMPVSNQTAKSNTSSFLDESSAMQLHTCVMSSDTAFYY